jgi:hypothetical protein
MTSADILRFVIIFSLGVLAFITFLVAGTLVGLMWFDSWSCGMCRHYPAGLYILGLLGLLLLASIAVDAGEGSRLLQENTDDVNYLLDTARAWFRRFWYILVAVLLSILTYFIVVNWWSIMNWWYCL